MKKFNVYVAYSSMLTVEADSEYQAKDKARKMSTEVLTNAIKEQSPLKVVEVIPTEIDNFARCSICKSRVVYNNYITQERYFLSKEGKFLGIFITEEEVMKEMHNTIQCINRICDYSIPFNYYFRN
jgi:hypothetical protein